MDDSSFRILLVEDDQSCYQMVLNILCRLPVTVDHATDTAQAMKFIDANVHELIIYNINLDSANSLTFMEFLRQESAAQLITMTSDNPKSLEKKVRGFRVVYHLIKPFTVSEITTILDHTITRARTKGQQNQTVLTGSAYQQL